jgi:hypothetical protein
MERKRARGAAAAAALQSSRCFFIYKFCGIIVIIIIVIISLMDYRAVNVYLIRLLLHIDYDGRARSEKEWEIKRERAHWKYKHPLYLAHSLTYSPIHDTTVKPGNDPLILSRMNAEMLNGYDDALN